MLVMGYVILLWHSLSLLYNYFAILNNVRNANRRHYTKQEAMAITLFLSAELFGSIKTFAGMFTNCFDARTYLPLPTCFSIGQRGVSNISKHVQISHHRMSVSQEHRNGTIKPKAAMEGVQKHSTSSAF